MKEGQELSRPKEQLMWGHWRRVGQGESLAGSINQKTVGQRREGAGLEG